MNDTIHALSADDDTCLRLVHEHGYEGARFEIARWRDMNAWGTYSYALHNQTMKALERLRGELP